MTAIKGLLFDVFGTVVDWEGSVSRQVQHSDAANATRNYSERDDFDAVEFSRAWRAGYMRRTKEISQGFPGPTNVDALHLELLEGLLSESGPYSYLSKALSPEDRLEWCKFWHKLDGWPDAAKGLDMLQKLNPTVLTGTLSNGSARLLIDLARHASLKFDVILSGDIIESYKPNQKMYKKGVQVLGLEMGEAAMVASHIYDLQAAKGFGMRTIYVRRHTEDKGLPEVKTKGDGGDVDAIVDGLDELADVLESWKEES